MRGHLVLGRRTSDQDLLLFFACLKASPLILCLAFQDGFPIIANTAWLSRLRVGGRSATLSESKCSKIFVALNPRHQGYELCFGRRLRDQLLLGTVLMQMVLWMTRFEENCKTLMWTRAGGEKRGVSESFQRKHIRGRVGEVESKMWMWAHILQQTSQPNLQLSQVFRLRWGCHWNSVAQIRSGSGTEPEQRTQDVLCSFDPLLALRVLWIGFQRWLARTLGGEGLGRCSGSSYSGTENADVLLEELVSVEVLMQVQTELVITTLTPNYLKTLARQSSTTSGVPWQLFRRCPLNPD